MTSLDPDLATAESLLGGVLAASPGWWSRAVAVMGRSAIESALRRYWRLRAPGVEQCSFRAQLLCLHGYIDRPLVRRTAAAWSGLSRACHHHPWDLSPTLGELEQLVGAARQFADEVDRQIESSRSHRRGAPGSP